MPERDVTLQMGVNSKEAMKAMEDFEKAAKRLSQVLSHTSAPSKELRKTFSDLRKTSSEYNSVLRKLQSNTDAYNSALSRQEELERRLSLQQRSLENKREKTNQVVAAKSAEIEKINELIEKYTTLNNALREYRKDRNEDNRNALSAATRDANIKGMESIKDVRVTRVNELIEEQKQKIAVLKNQIDAANLSYEKQAQSVQNTSNRLETQKQKVSELYGKIGEGTEKLTKYSTEFVETVGKTEVQNVFNNIRNAVKGMVSDFGKLISLLKRAVSIISKLSGISTILKSFKSALGGSNTELKTALRYIIQYGLGFRSLFFLVRRLRSAFVDALEDMGKSIPQVQESLDSLSISMNTLKAALAVAFAPLLKFVAALMERLAAVAINAANAIAQFFAVLTRQNVWYKMTSGASGYTDAVKGSTKATKDNEKALKKQLAAFDDIDVLVKDLDDDLENMSPGGSGGLDGSAMGTWEPLNNPYSELADLILKAWASDDVLTAFEEVGRYIGTALQKALDKLLTDFWPPLRAKAEKIALAIAGTINGFFQTDAVVSLAKNIAAAINTALGTLSNYWNGVNWGNMGAKLRISIEALIDDIEWDTLAEYLKGKLKGLIELASGVMGDGSWVKKVADNVGGVIEHILKNVDFNKLGSTINAFLTNLFDGITGILQKNEKGVSNAISDFLTGLKPSQIIVSFGKMIFELFKLAIKEGFKLLTSSGFMLPLLTGFLAFELGKAALKTFLSQAFATLISIALTSMLGEAALATGVTTASTGIFALLSSGLTIAFGGLAAVIGGLIGVALIDSYAHMEEPIDIMKNAFIADTQAIMQEINFTIAGSEQQLVDTVTGIVTKLGIVEEGYRASSLAEFNNYVGEIIGGYGFTESEVVSIMSSMYSTLGYDLSSFTGTTLGQLSAFISGIISETGKVESGIDVDTTNIQTNVQETETRAEESSQGFVTAFKDMAEGVSTAASDIAGSPIKPVVDTSSIDVGIAKLNTFLALAAQAGAATSAVGSISSVKASISSAARKLGATRMAKGGVIPPNKPFLAMLGDQTKGTNVEAPLSTITEALHNALTSYGFSGIGGNQEVVLNIDGATLARLTVPYNLDELNRKGYNVKVLERK